MMLFLRVTQFDVFFSKVFTTDPRSFGTLWEILLEHSGDLAVDLVVFILQSVRLVTFVSIPDTCDWSYDSREGQVTFQFFSPNLQHFDDVAPANQFWRFYRLTAHRHVNSDQYANQKVHRWVLWAGDVNDPFETLSPFGSWMHWNTLSPI